MSSITSSSGSTSPPERGSSGAAAAAAKRLVGPAIAGGLLGGLLMIGLMIIVMGVQGKGYATPLNVGMAAFVYTVAPPLSMLPKLMAAMGIKLPAAVMAQLMPAIHSGHIPPMMLHKLGPMLMSSGVPPAKVQLMGQLMSGHATNSTVAKLMSGMTPHARKMVMSAMPVHASHVVVGAILHFAFATFLAFTFFGIIAAAAWLAIPGLRTWWAPILFSMIGAGIAYVVNRWGILPPINPIMAFVPQAWFFVGHMLFGFAVGVALAMALRQRAVRTAMSPTPGVALA